MMERVLSFLRDHKEIALATSEGNMPKLRIFQIMKQEEHVLYFATSSKKAVYRELRQNPNVEILAYADNMGLHRNDVIPASCMASRRNSKYRSSVKPKPHASSP